MSDDPPITDPKPEFKPPASQEEFDRMVGARLERERAKFSDYDDVKAKAAKFDELDAASKSELQKAQDAIAERDAKLADLPKQIRKQVLQFASIAAGKGFVDPEDALVFLGDVDLGDDKAVAAALDDLAVRKPHLVRTPAKKQRTLPARPRPDGNGADPDPAGQEPEGKERAAAALRQFRNVR